MTVESGAHNLSVSPNVNQIAYIQNGDLWLADLNSKINLQLTNIGISSLSDITNGRYNRPEREIGPGIWSGPTYKWSPDCLLYTSPSPRDATLSRMPSSA